MRLQSDPCQGTLLTVHRPDSVRSARPGATSNSDARGSTSTDPMMGPSWEIRKHSNKPGTKSSSKFRRLDSSAPGATAHSKSHWPEKKTHKQWDPMVPGGKLSVPPSPAPHKKREPPALGQTSASVLATRKERVLLKPGKSGAMAAPKEVFTLLDAEMSSLLGPSTSGERKSLPRICLRYRVSRLLCICLYTIPSVPTVPLLELESAFFSSNEL